VDGTLGTMVLPDLRGPRHARAAGRLLLACVTDGRSGARELLPPGGPERALVLQRLVLAAHRHGVVAPVVDALAGTTDPALDALRAQHRHRMALTMLALAELPAVGRTLDAAQVPWVVVKGPVLATAYDQPGARGYHDLDLVVPGSSLAVAIEALEASGLTLLDRNWELVLEQMRGQVHLACPSGTLIDLHWHLVNVGRERFRIPMREVIERRRMVTVDGLAVPTLDRTDTLLHVALHASLSGGDRLVWLTDLRQLIRSEPPDWAEVVERATSWGIAAPVATMLLRARARVGADVPDDALAALLPRRSGRWVAAAVAAAARPERWAGPSPARLLARSAGLGVGPGTRFALRRLTGKLTQHHEADLGHRLLQPAGGAAGRERYLTSVRATCLAEDTLVREGRR
jgi:hypothetical protein